MKIDRVLASIAVILSMFALVVATMALRRNPMGSGLASYDLSSPEKSILAARKMIANRDLNAGFDLIGIFGQQELVDSVKADPGAKLFLSQASEISVVKSIEVHGSAVPENNGLIVSFVNFKVDPIEYHVVINFRKHQLGRFLLGNMTAIPNGTEPSESDKALQAMEDAFNKTGKF